MFNKLDARKEIKVNLPPQVGYRKIGEKFVVFSCTTHQIAILNDSGELLCRYIANNRWTDIEDLVRLLVRKFLITKKQARCDVKKFINRMVILGMMEVNNRLDQERVYTEGTKMDGEKLLLEIEKHAIRKTIPFSTTFELTYKCNEKCIHCYMDKGRKDLLTTKDIERILVSLKNEKCLFVTFTGGEIFVRPDVVEVISLAGDRHFVIDILTNGTLINERIIEALLQNPIRRLQISIYGADAKTHEKVTKIPGSFKQTITGIHLLREAGIKVEVAFLLMKFNFHQRYKVKEMVEKLDCLLLPSPIITARNNGRKDTWQLRLSDIQLRELMSDKALFGLYSGRKPFQEHQFYLGFKNLKEANPCYSGINSCAINPKGEVFPCNQLLFRLGNCKKNSFSEIWHKSSKLKWLRFIKVKDLPECSNCSLLPYCARCPGLAYIENGSLLGKSPENCRIARIWFEIQNEGR